MRKKPSAILVGDLHLRDTQPRCRTDDFVKTQRRKGEWLTHLWNSHGKPPVLQSGDVFDIWKSSPLTINTLISYYPPMITIPGNPGKHNYYDQTALGLHRDALYTLELANVGWNLLFGAEPIRLPDFEVYAVMWGEQFPTFPKGDLKSRIIISHLMVLDGPSKFAGIHGKDLLKKVPKWPIILTGHNHKPMIFEHKGRRLINPGSFTRQRADENHEPRVYLWWHDTNEIEPEYVPIEKDVINRSYIDDPKREEERMEAFIELLPNPDDPTWSGGIVKFRDNMVQYLTKTMMRDSVKGIITEAMNISEKELQ